MKVRDILAKETGTLSVPVTNRTLHEAPIEFWALGYPCCLESRYCLCEPQRDIGITICPKRISLEPGGLDSRFSPAIKPLCAKGRLLDFSGPQFPQVYNEDG